MVKTVAVEIPFRLHKGVPWWNRKLTLLERWELEEQGAYETWAVVRAGYANDIEYFRNNINNPKIDLEIFFTVKTAWMIREREVFDVFCAVCTGQSDQHQVLAIEVAKRMIAAGVDVRAPRYFGQTMLMVAAIFRRSNVVAYLLPFSDAEAKNPQGADALTIAEERGAEDIAGMIRTHIEREELRALGLPAVDDPKPEDAPPEEPSTGMTRETL